MTAIAPRSVMPSKLPTHRWLDRPYQQFYGHPLPNSGPGEYGVADPNRQPYDIITATLAVWAEATDGKRARVVPWLEDTNYRAWDRPLQVREQIRATLDAGIDEWLMWDPNVRYTTGAYRARD